MSSLTPVPAMISSRHRLRWRKAKICRLHREKMSLFYVSLSCIFKTKLLFTHLIPKLSEHELNMRQI